MENTTQGDWITSQRFWLDTFERVVRTTAQAAMAVFGVGAATGVVDGGGVVANWQEKAVMICGTALLTFITCLAGRSMGDPSTASLTSGTDHEQGRS